jgi:hypothetical protein
MYEDMQNALVGGTAAGYASEKMVRMPTMKDRLAEAVASAEARLADAKRAKEIFDAHPELEELLNIMQRGRF